MSPPQRSEADEIHNLLTELRVLASVVASNHTASMSAHTRHTEQIKALTGQLFSGTERDAAVEKRVTRIEIERDNEEEARHRVQRADRRISAGISGAVSSIGIIAKLAWNFYHPSAG